MHIIMVISYDFYNPQNQNQILESHQVRMENYQTMFQSSSPTPSHTSLLKMLNSHAQIHYQFQDHNPNGVLQNYNPSSAMGNSNTVEMENEAKTGKKKKEEKKKSRNRRFAFQTRSQVDILDDGYRWRKYGQKAVKNNKFPRSYYRCTYKECNVKKQVQRLSGDEGIVVTTYEGMHSHPIDKSNDNFEHILSQMQIYPSF